MKIVYFLVLASVSGCATPTTGVVPRGDGMLTITRQGGSAFVSTESLKAAAMQDAEAHCASKKKQFKFLHNKDTQAGPLGRWPESEVLFRCE